MSSNLVSSNILSKNDHDELINFIRDQKIATPSNIYQNDNYRTANEQFLNQTIERRDNFRKDNCGIVERSLSVDASEVSGGNLMKY